MNRYMGEGPANLVQQRRHPDGTACFEGSSCPLLAAPEPIRNHPTKEES